MTRVPGDPFLPFETRRTLLRPLGPDDAAALAAYRNDPHVAKFQDWELPFSEEAATALIAAQADLTGPAAGRWIQIGIEHDRELVGDLAIGLDPSGALATLGHTLRADRQGRGLAIEAVGAAVDRLFALTGVHRVGATLDPDNVGSARLLERLGFRYEGRAVSAAPVRGAWLDDDRYALLTSDRAAWLARATNRPARVRLVHIDRDNLPQLTAITLQPSQERYAQSVRDALLEVLVPPIEHGVTQTLGARAVEADGEIVGLVLANQATAVNLDPDVVWLIIDRWHQRRGIGTAVIRLLAEVERRDDQESLWARWPVEAAGIRRFFEAVGFVVVGEVDGRAEARLDLDPPPPDLA